MRHHNSVFHDLLKRVPWNVFDEHVSDHGLGKHVRHLTTKDQFIALLYGQLSGATSLREIVGSLESHSARLYHVGGHMSRALDAVRCQRAASQRGFLRAFRRDGGARGGACATNSATPPI